MEKAVRILVTGGSRGIGRSVVEKLVKHGARVAFTYREDYEGACRLLDTGAGAAFKTDVSSYGQAVDVVASLEETWGGIDGLVCNAGIGLDGLFSESEPAQWDKLWRINVEGVFNYCRAAIPFMTRRKSGSIVTLGSVWGEDGGSCEAVYSATKGAVKSFSLALADELGPSGIRVNCVAPGAISTDMNGHLEKEERRHLCENIPLGKLGAPGDVADAVIFLLGDNSRYVTGTVLRVSGGL